MKPLMFMVNAASKEKRYLMSWVLARRRVDISEVGLYFIV